MQDKGKLLVFQADFMSLNIIRKICAELDLECMEVSVRDYDKSMLALTGTGKSAKSGANTDLLPGPMLVFAGIKSQVMDMFLEKYKEAGDIGHPLKAVLTMYNSFWNPKQLYGELVKEHKKFGNGQ